MIEFDFGFPGRPTFTDLWLEFHDVPTVGNVRVGRWRHPFSMDALTSIKGLTFLERALPFAFGPFRQLGVGVYDYADNERFTWAVSGFHFPSNQFGNNLGDAGGFAMASRATILAIDENAGSRLLHLGANFSYGDPSDDLIRYRTSPEFFISETGGVASPSGVPNQVPSFVDTGNINTSTFKLAGVEMAAVFGRLYLQSGWIHAFVDQINGPALGFSGMYAHAGYFLTGETREYDRHNGIVARVNPQQNLGGEGGIGAWEVAARWSYIDLNDQNIAGNRLQTATAGLNWYSNPRTRFQFAFIHAFLNDTSQGDSDTDIFALRTQLDF